MPKSKMEYIKIGHSEQIYGKKNLLYSQMEILNIKKRFQTYKKLRMLEFKIKSLLKRKIKMLKEELNTFDSVTPKIKKSNFEIKSMKNYPKRKELEYEIEEIRKKLAELQ